VTVADKPENLKTILRFVEIFVKPMVTVADEPEN